MLKLILVLSIVNLSLCLNESSALYTEIFTYHNETSLKAEFAFQVVNKIFNVFEQWFFTITFCEFTYFENRILKYTENYGYGYPVMLLNGCQDSNTTKVKPKLDTHGNTAYLVTSQSLTIENSEYVLEALIRTGVFKPRSAIIFVINTPVEMTSYFSYDMVNHFQLLWGRSISNSIIVIWTDKLRMYSYNPFYEQIKEVSDVQDITQLLTRQHEDLNGHEIRLSVFRIIYVSDETGPVHCGSKLATTAMKVLNATCKPLPPRDGNTVGDLLPNGTATGVTADLMDGYTDMEFNSRILKNSYYGYIDTTYPLVQDELCFIIKKATTQSTFKTTLKLISFNMLLLFLFTAIVFVGFSLFIRKMETNIFEMEDCRSTSETVIDLVKCFIRQTVDMKYAGPVFRAVTLMIMIYSLIIDCAIDGIITSAIAYPRYKEDINTLDELLKTNMTFGVHNRHLRIYRRSVNDDLVEEVMKRTEVLDDHKIKDIIEKRKYNYAVLLRKSDAQYISRKPSNMKDGRPLYHTVTDCPVPCSIVYGLRYGSPYLPRLNYLLKHLNQAGILHYWTESDEYTLIRTHNTAIYGENNNKKKPLNINNVKEVIIVWAFGLLISTVVFISEIIVHIITAMPVI